MQYTGDIATIQRRIAETSDLYRRRLAVLDVLDPRPGERIIEVGCGGGALLPSIGAAVGPGGRVVGIDISEDQIAAARERCADQSNIETAAHDLRSLPQALGGFDAVVAVQVIEYLDDPKQALAALHRVVAQGGRAVILATNWDTVYWHTGTDNLTRKVQLAWRQHAPHPNLPADLRALLAETGFQTVRQTPVPIVNTSYHGDTFAYWAAQLMVAFCLARNLISKGEADAWLASLSAMDKAGRFFVSSTPILTSVVAVRL
jgi:ubiquinone/menaquinone biosynthesis C-methylase UbiE